MPEPDAPRPSWAVPQLLRAFWQGHRAHRERLLRLIGRLDAGALSRDPVLSDFRRLLRGDDLALARKVGRLIARRGLSVYGSDLVELLRDGERRKDARRWLRHPQFPRPVEALIALALDEAAPIPARRAALRLLRSTPLARVAVARLLPVLATRALQREALRLFGDAVDAGLLLAAIAANRARGAALLRRPAHTPSWLARWLFPPRPNAFGVYPPVASAQEGFVLGIARLAIATESRPHLEALFPYLFHPELGPELREAAVRLQLDALRRPLLRHLDEGRDPAPCMELLGRLGADEATPRILRFLPAFGRALGPAHRAALVALARLGAADAIEPYLQGALAAFRQLLGDSPQGTPGHPSSWAPCFEAATIRRDPRFAEIGLRLLRLGTVSELREALVDGLTHLAPLELVPTLAGLLEREEVPRDARTLAVAVAERAELAVLAPQLAEAGRRRGVALPAARALARLTRAEDVDAVAPLLATRSLPDPEALALFERCAEVGDDARVRGLARELLVAGAGGTRTQRRALACLRAGDPAALLETCVTLLDSPHAAVRSEALREGLARGLLEPAPRDEHCAALLRCARAALLREDGGTGPQLRALCDALAARAPDGALDPAAAAALRSRLLQAHLWSELPTFLAMHRELCDLAGQGLDLGPIHGALLQLIGARRFRDPLSGASGPYPGPLPRFEECFASSSPEVQEGLFDLVRGAGYLRPQRLVLRFLGSPRPRARREALGLLRRETCVDFGPEVLALLHDPQPSVRRATVETLARHELERYGAELRPLLRDADEAVRLAATRVLGRWGDPESLNLLVEFLASDTARVRRDAALALRRFEPTRLVGLLAPFVSAERPRAAAAALHALQPERLPADDELAAAIFRLAAQGQGPLRGLALRFLPAVAAGRLGDVVPLLADAEPQVRAAAAHVLARRDGRRHAGAIAGLAAEVARTEVRREVLALLAQLGVPASARALLPLLLDEDPRIRAGTRQAVGAARGFSLQPELEACLRRGLDGGAPPAAIRELVELLGQIGDARVFPVVAEALRCEERPVWEAVLALARGRGETMHAGRLAEFVDARPLPPAKLLTLAVAELERCGRPEDRARLRTLAESHPAETVKRRALQAALALAPAGASPEETLAASLAQESARRVAELEKQARAKHPQVDPRAELRRVRGTVTQLAHRRLAQAATPAELQHAVKQLPSAAQRGTVSWHAAERALELLGAGDAEASPRGLAKALGRLPFPAPTRGAPAEPPLRLARGLRDRLAPAAFLKAVEALAPGDRDLSLQRAAWIAQLHRGDTPASWRSRLKAAPERVWPQLEGMLLCAMEHWRPELRELFADLLGEYRRRKQPLRSQREERFARAKLRMGLEVATPELRSSPAVLAAEDDVSGLRERLEGTQERGRVLTILGLLAEVGSDAAVAAIATRAASPEPRIRAGVADALGASGRTEAARAALAGLLEGEAAVPEPALAAVARLEDRAQADAVIRHLAHDRAGVRVAACRAAAALELELAAPILVGLLGQEAQVRRAAAQALGTLAGPAQADALLEALRSSSAAKDAGALERALERALPEARLDALGELLGAGNNHAVATALRVLASRGHRPIAPAARTLLEHPSPKVRKAACHALRELGDPEASQALLTRLEQDADASVQAAALRALAAGEPARLEPERARLRLLLRGPEPVARAAAQALAGLPADAATRRVLRERLGPRGWRERNTREAGFQLLQAWEAEEELSELAGEALERALGGWSPGEELLRPALPWVRTARPPGWSTRLVRLLAHPRAGGTLEHTLDALWELDPGAAAPFIVRRALHHSQPAAIERLGDLCRSEQGHPALRGVLRALLLERSEPVRRAARAALAELPADGAPPAALFAETLARARADDASCDVLRELLEDFDGRPLLGELLVGLYRTDTPAARATLTTALRRPFDARWEGAKRIAKLAEREQAAEPWADLAYACDRPHAHGWGFRSPSPETLAYMQRRLFRHLKALGRAHPQRFWEQLAALLLRYAEDGDSSPLLQRLLRGTPRLVRAGAHERFVARLENPFAADGETADLPDLMDLEPAELLRSAPAEPAPAGERPRSPRWAGPLFAELWVREPARLVELLGRLAGNEALVAIILRLLRERVGEALLAVPLGAFYALLAHPLYPVVQWALGQIAARARAERVRFDELVAPFERAVQEADWEAIADILWVLDDERAEAERAGLAEPLRQLILRQRDAPGIGPVVGFFRRHLGGRLGPPLFAWPAALGLAGATRPDVRELARELVARLGREVPAEPEQLRALLASALVDEDPELLGRVLDEGAPAGELRGYRPPERWPLADCARACETLPQAGFQLLRRVLLRWEEGDGLDPALARRLLAGRAPDERQDVSTRRGRSLGMELFAAALAREALGFFDLAQLLLEPHAEDVVVWARERLEQAAARGALPNAVLYRLLDSTQQDLSRFARELVREHLRRFQVAELVVFCAESPDAATADLGLQLYEQELAGRDGHDLRALLPMFRILLYRVATARAEKERLFHTLRRWALEAPEHARLVVEVVSAFRRSEARVDLRRALTLLALIKDRHPQVALPFATREVFGATL